jgi:hypothetical protein
MLKVARQWPARVWAVEGVNGIGRPVAQRLLADGEQVLDVPAKLAARAPVEPPEGLDEPRRSLGLGHDEQVAGVPVALDRGPRYGGERCEGHQCGGLVVELGVDFGEVRGGDEAGHCLRQLGAHLFLVLGLGERGTRLAGSRR